MRIHLAGCEDFKFVNAVAFTGHPLALSSYHYLKSKPKERIQQVVDTFNAAGVEVIIDSGIFTMMFGAGAGKKYDIESMIDYTAQYIETAPKFGFKKFTMVECDVHKILGMDAVFKLREMFKKSGHDVMYVWHLEEGLPGLDLMSRAYPYIAVGCPELRKLFKNTGTTYKTAVWDLLSRIQKASPKMPKVHLLGNTVQESLQTHLAYSCDSTSWIAGVKFGRGPVFDNGKIISASIRSPIFVACREKFISQNPAYEQWVVEHLETEKSREYYRSIYASAMAFKLYQAYLDRKYKWIGEQNG